MKPSETLTLPTRAELFEALQAEAQNPASDAYCPEITNWAVGGIFRSLIQLIAVAATGANSVSARVFDAGFVLSATDDELTAHARGLGLARKGAQAAVVAGLKFVRAAGPTTSPVTIPERTPVTVTGVNGDRLAFFTTAAATISAGQTLSGAVTAQAEAVGAIYNTVAENRFAGAVVAVPIAGLAAGAAALNTAALTLQQVGADDERDDDLRARCILRWAAGRDSIEGLREAALAVAGVAEVAVNDRQPYGPGSAAVIVRPGTSSELVAAVQTQIDQIVSAVGIVQAVGADPVTVNIYTIVRVQPGANLPGVQADVAAALGALFARNDAYPNVPTIGLGQMLANARVVQTIMDRPFVVDVLLLAVNGSGDNLVPAADEYIVPGTITVLVRDSGVTT
jgi:hypothetical protein